MMFASLLFLMSLIHIAQSECNRGYEQYENSCYKVSGLLDYASFQSAAWKCELDGGDLASIPNSFVDTFVRKLAEKSGVSDYWIGLKCPKGNLTACYWIDTTPVKYNNFYIGYPSVIGESTAVSLQYLARAHGKWYSSNSQTLLRDVCEQKTIDKSTKETETSTTEVPTTTSTEQVTTTVPVSSTTEPITTATTSVQASTSNLASSPSVENRPTTAHPKKLEKVVRHLVTALFNINNQL